MDISHGFSCSTIFVINDKKMKVLSPSLKKVFYSLKWAHDISEVKNPCSSKIVIFMLDSARKICGQPIDKKKTYNFCYYTRYV
jgi:hypothetical protein